MSLRLMIEGSNEKVSTFTSLLQKLLRYRIYHQTKQPISKNELRLEYYLDERKPLPPSIKGTEVKTLKLTDYKGKEIEITLLGCNAVNMQDGSTIIYGRNYDIFSG